MEENKDVDMEEIEVCMSRQTPLIFPFEEEKVNFEIKNITISEVINPSPHTFQLWYPQEESLTNLQFFSYSKKLSRLIELEFRSRKRKTGNEEQKNISQGPEYIKKIKKGRRASKISFSDKIRVLEYTNNHRECSWRFIGSVFGISHCQVRKIWLNQWDYSLLSDKRNNYRSTMTNDVKTKIDKICKDLDPTLTISERTKILNSDGCDAKPHQVYYYMKKKYSHKRSRFHPYQRKYVGNVLKRQCFAAKLIDTLEEGKQIVNIDEFGLDFSKRNYGWSEKGSKCLGFKTSMKRFYSIIIAVSNWNGIIAWRAIGENNNAKKFNNFIADLTKYIYSQDRDFREYTVFFLDNSKIHTSAINKELYEKLGLFVLFGTPYTPQFAFVERIISYIKAKVKICEDTLLESLKYSVNKTQEILDMEKIMRNILNSYGSKALKLEDLGD